MKLKPRERNKIFSRLKAVLKSQCPPMVVSKNTADTFEIMGNKPVPYGSAKKIVPGMYFSSVVARKDMVSFYFFPLYTHTEAFSHIAPTIMKCLKGKTCFNFKKEEHLVDREIETLLKKGAQIWRNLGYLK